MINFIVSFNYDKFVLLISNFIFLYFNISNSFFNVLISLANCHVKHNYTNKNNCLFS